MADKKQKKKFGGENAEDQPCEVEEASLLLQQSFQGGKNKSASQHSLPNTMAEIIIKRSAYDQSAFDKEYHKIKEETPPFCTRVSSYFSRRCTCSAACMTTSLFSWFPFLLVLKTYQWKKWIVSDLIAGLCVGVIHIPQSMGFAILTSLPPAYGLYATIFPVLIYFIFGTSKHISMGTMAVISIMVGIIVDREADLWLASRPIIATTTTMAPSSTTLSALSETENFFNNITNSLSNNSVSVEGDNDSDPELIQFKVEIAMSVSLMIGLFQLGMSFLNMGVLATFMSMPFVGAFMTGAATHIITSQAPFGLGYTIPRQAGMFRVPKSWYLILANITEINAGATICFILCSAFLIGCKIINDKFAHKMKIPIPAELFVIIISALVSYFGKLHDNFGVRILKTIPTGMPTPEIPTLYNGTSYILDSFIIAVISYSICISMAKNFAVKYRYKLDQNQELFALGMMHTVSAFFHGFAGAQAPPRTLVHEGTSGKSQLASLVSAFLVLLVVLVLAPLFEPLPNSALAAIIIVALLPLYKQIASMPFYWRVNKYDCIVWMATFLGVVMLNIDAGLLIGIGMSMLSVVIHTYMAQGDLLSPADHTELYKNKTVYSGLSKLHPNIFIFKFEGPLYFPNVDTFKVQLFEKTLNPVTLIKDKNSNIDGVVVDKNQPPGESSPAEETSVSYGSIHISETAMEIEGSIQNGSVGGKKTEEPFSSIAVIVLDCSAVCYIDLTGLNVLKSLKGLYTDAGVELVLVGCSEELLRKLDINGYDITRDIYPSIQDAVSMTTIQQPGH